MPSSISKENLLQILIARGFTSPIPEPFVKETEKILFEEFHLDRATVSEEVVASIKNSATRFRDSVKDYYAKYQDLNPILNKDKHKVRSLTAFSQF